MARMIPPVIANDTPSHGEVEIFGKLRDDSATSDWIVLHSLDVAHHLTRIAGEIDFVVLMPGKGVLCVEVKAHSHVRHSDGQWLFGPHEEPGRSPFKQVAAAMHSIRDWVRERHPALSGIVFWSCVVFPRVDVPIASPEWRSWQLIDRRAYESRPIGVLLESVLDRAAELLAEQRPTWLPTGSAGPSPERCRLVAQLLRPEFEVFESPKARRRREDAAIRRFTEDQFDALDDMDMNQRVVFHGPAGTGKTLLAIEATRRGHDSGRRVLLVCFNELLGRWLREQTEPLRDRVTAGTLHQHMLRLSGPSTQVEGESREFWQERLPLQAMEALVSHGRDQDLFDEVIVDEAQDLLRASYLEVLDLCLRGGLKRGRVRMFGDFEKQAVYDAADLPLEQLKVRYCPDVAFRGLRTNCRNTPRVVGIVRQLCALGPDYKRVLRPDDHVTPRIRYYKDATSQHRLLTETLSGLYDEKFTGRDIVVLSANGDRACAASGMLASPWHERLSPLREAGRGQIGYCSIRSFKGLEAPAVVVTDLEHVEDEEARAQLYVALTRPLHRLVVLASERTRPDLARMLIA